MLERPVELSVSEAESQKVKDAAKEAARVAKEATEAAKRASYERGVQRTDWLRRWLKCVGITALRLG